MEGYIGEIRMFAGSWAPRNWMICNGQLLAISQYTALFSIIGTNYGGDGRTTFGVPDLQGRVAVGNGAGSGLTPKYMGEKSGAETTTLAVSNLPAHNHTAAVTQSSISLKAANGDATNNNPQGRSLANSLFGRDTVFTYSEEAPTVAMHSDSAILANVTIDVGNTGQNTPVNNMQPYQVVQYIICLDGIFPSRN